MKKTFLLYIICSCFLFSNAQIEAPFFYDFEQYSNDYWIADWNDGIWSRIQEGAPYVAVQSKDNNDIGILGAAPYEGDKCLNLYLQYGTSSDGLKPADVTYWYNDVRLNTLMNLDSQYRLKFAYNYAYRADGEYIVPTEVVGDEMVEYGYDEEGIYFSDDDGVTYTLVKKYKKTVGWQLETIDVNKVCDEHSLNLNNPIKIRFVVYNTRWRGPDELEFNEETGGYRWYNQTREKFLQIDNIEIEEITMANNYVTYSYDNAGNRTHKVVTIDENSLLKSAPIDSIEINENEPTEFALSDMVSVSPNPTKGNTYIQISNMNEEKNYKFSVLNIDGVFFSRAVPITSNRHKIDLSSYSAGLYFIIVTDGFEQVTHKLVKE